MKTQSSAADGSGKGQPNPPTHHGAPGGPAGPTGAPGGPGARPTPPPSSTPPPGPPPRPAQPSSPGPQVVGGWDPRKGGELFDDGDDEPELDPLQLKPPTEEDLLGLEADLEMAIVDYGFGYRRCAKLIRQMVGLRVNSTLLWRFRQRRHREKLAAAERRSAEARAADAGTGADPASSPAGGDIPGRDAAPGAPGVPSAPDGVDPEWAAQVARVTQSVSGTPPDTQGLELAQRMAYECLQARFREMNVCAAIEVKDLVGMMMQVEGMALRRQMFRLAEAKFAHQLAKDARAARREDARDPAEDSPAATGGGHRRRLARPGGAPRATAPWLYPAHGSAALRE